MTVEGFAGLRRALLGLTAAICVIYAAMALWLGRPDPMLWFVPLMFGIASALVLFGLGSTLARATAGAASDELYRATSHRAQRHAYWVTLAMMPLVIGGVKSGIADWPTAFAAFGCLAGGTYLALLVCYEGSNG